MSPDYAARLLEWLPARWREEDSSGDLKRLLAVYGELLDALHATVEQRRADSFPDLDPDGEHCQAWLLPYFAQLLDVSLVSPDEAGRRAELADAVAWRQRKGTRRAIEAIAEAVGQFEVEIQEGWKRVAITPRVDRALLPEAAYGEAAIAEPATPALRARHPGLPAATLDLRYCSRAVQCDTGNSGAHTTTFAGAPVTWRQVNRHGLPCQADGYQDVSRRTADLRTPDGRRGHAHPRRVLLHLAPPDGFFAPAPASRDWSGLAGAVAAALATDLGSDSDRLWQDGDVEFELRRGTWQGAERPRLTLRALTPAPLRLTGVVQLAEAAVYRFENFWFDDRLEVGNGAVELAGCALRRVQVAGAAADAPVLAARACLFGELAAAAGRVRLEYATVLDSLVAAELEASDSILLPPLRADGVGDDVPAAGCIRYSRLFYIPADEELAGTPWRSDGHIADLRCYGASCSTAVPLFWNTAFGSPGCAVLHPDCDPAIQAGAEDGGEMGACHDYRHVLRRRAVLDKLQEFLPVGMEAVLVADSGLACPPPVAI
ncbi:phage tail protein [Parasulfuritortus cantonensis]|uniref:phage tail protein n=1 Tax=Parasulfuritortus cantonensis TaxID=2528202 RepID=UPI00197FE166|nr:phage tail protein [Parasulfuritortus cantonensis]